MPTPQQNTEDILRLMLQSICQRTKEPEVNLMPDRLICKVHPDDQGRCVGKKGLNFWAMSTIMWWVSTAQLVTPLTLRLLEPEVTSRKRPQPPFRPPTKWDQIDLTQLARLVDEILLAVFKEKRPLVIERGPQVGHVRILVRLPKYLQTPMASPEFSEALTVYLRTVGMVKGLEITTDVSWV